MSSIKDFKCTYDNGVLEHSKIVEELGFTFPDVYLHADKMAALSKRQKEKQGNSICVLPFCHTVEGEAMGGIITLGNEVAGQRNIFIQIIRSLGKSMKLILQKEEFRKFFRPVRFCTNKENM